MLLVDGHNGFGDYCLDSRERDDWYPHLWV